MTEMPDPTQEDVSWAFYLWNSMAIGGRWVCQGVGAYVRTDTKELTLTEIHFAKPQTDPLGVGIFDKHHWIMALGDLVGWTIKEDVEIAKDEEGELNIPDELVGHVSVCGSRCGAVIRVESPKAGEVYMKIDDDLTCPCCGEVFAIDPALAGIHVLVDDRAFKLNRARQEEE